jgi:hypothetical protein
MATGWLRWGLVLSLAESEDLDDRIGESEDPDEMRGHSKDPDSLVEDSEDPDDLRGRYGDPDDMQGTSHDPDEMTGRSHELSNLPAAVSDESSEIRIVEMPEPPGPNDGARTRAAWSRVESSSTYLDGMNDTYQRMMDANYPRGERRARIIAERNAAIEAANQARTAYRELQGR